MKRLMLILSLLPAFLHPSSAQTVPEIKSGAEYLGYVEQLRERLAPLYAERDAGIAGVKKKAEELLAQAEATADPEQKQRLMDEARLVTRSVDGVLRNYDRQIIPLEEQLRDVRMRYMFVFEEAFPFYEEREQYSKEELKGYLKQASREIRRSPSGKALRKYIKTLP